MDIYVASPEGAKNLPVLLIFMEAFGINFHIQNVCKRFAQEGFLVASPDLYHRFGRKLIIPYEDRKTFLPLLGQMTNEEILEDVRATLSFLKNLEGAFTDKVSTLGFCVGGFASLLSASELDLYKCVSFYGSGVVRPREGISLNPFVQKLEHMKVPSLLFFGGQDASIPAGDIKEIEKNLMKSGTPFEVDIFQGSDHGFFCEERKTYDQGSSKIAFEKSLAYLKS